MNPGKVFLTAQWRYLAMLNYDVDPALLHRFVPAGTELDLWNGHAFLSLVGFRFLNTKVFGISFPFYSNFEEVNLRLYVQRRDGALVKRGVVFIREIVPRWVIATVARTLYNEQYVSLPMSHQIAPFDAGLAVGYGWKFGSRWNRLSLTVRGDAELPEVGSEEQFITEHYWGYAAQRDGGCIEYQVAHPPWKVWSSQDARFEGDIKELYGKDLAAVLEKKPTSAFLAEGSEVTVYKGGRL
ncbi:MAG TPA: DUF2071 domain-containing protein [Terriglobales bacterium]|jgi:uncharacterized protein YqjF (DUF2071 family)|nr:DUF2071 domain-containing protein [Terriglobales bacterium]